MFDTLMTYWVFKRLSEKLIAQDLGGLEALEHQVLIQALYQDIVLRLCKLGDPRKDTWSLRQVAKYMKKHHPIRSFPVDIETKIGDYQLAIEGIKDDQRNRYMAHRSKVRVGSFKPPDDFRIAILLAVQICDELHGETVEYTISPGWAGIEVNLRELLS